VDYTILYDNALGTGVFTNLKSNHSTTSYTATGLTAGKTYTFKVEARNSYDLSAPSAPVAILCQYVPATPAAPTSLVVGNKAIISWTAPNDGGQQILGYRVLIRQTDGLYSLNLQDCNASDPLISSAKSCTIPLSSLTAGPFSLGLGELINARVVAYS